MKNHRDFALYVRNGVAINALVVFSQDIVTPATQTEPEKHTELLTLAYLEPGLQSSIPSGDQIRSNFKTAFSVPPLTEGLVNGWKDVVDVTVQEPTPLMKSSGRDGDAGDWTQAGADKDGFPVAKGSPEDVTVNHTPVSSPNAEPLKNPLPTEPEAIAAAQVADSAPENNSISGPDGLTDAQRGFKWGSDEHKAAIGHVPASEEFVQPDPEAAAEAKQ